MSSYVTPALMGSPKSKVVTTVVYQQFVVVFNWHFGAVLVAILLATSRFADRDLFDFCHGESLASDSR